jgi:proteic killer suppression protein
LAFNVIRYTIVIQSFRCKETESLFRGERIRRFGGIERIAMRKLQELNAAISPADLYRLPGNRYEALAGGRKGQYSIRLNDQWRICFE